MTDPFAPSRVLLPTTTLERNEQLKTAPTPLRVVEMYASYQGEGPNTGLPTVFVRFAGCNFKCAGWACDTQHAIDPKLFRKTQVPYDPYELADKVHEFGIRNICLTGGEVFLQNHDSLEGFTRRLGNNDHNVEVFTNGALDWPEWAYESYIQNFIVDWKLPGSGEFPDDEKMLDKLKEMGDEDAIKFTILDRADYERALYIYDRWIKPLPFSSRPLVYCGVVWDKLKTDELCTWMLADKLDWRLNVQVHKFIWHPDTIGV
jgi:7-carboxy-7-deazaguanine synthase